MDNYHIPVLLKEAIEYLDVKKNGKYIDGTIGGGGHSLEILKQGGKVLGIDADQEAIDYVQQKIKYQKSKIKNIEEKLTLVRGNFRNIDEIARLASTQAKRARLNNFENADGILLDLGVSSHQIETPERGFSYARTGPLDMRMDKDLAVSAADLINVLTKGELYELFTKLGEADRALAISSHIIRARRIKPISTTEELVSILGKSYGFKKGIFSEKMRAEVSAKVFQALRIVVNDELDSLREALPKALKLLKNKGRLVVISFHSLEDRIVKDKFKEFEKAGLGKVLTKKVIVPGEEEIQRNKRSRSSKMRVFEKI